MAQQTINVGAAPNDGTGTPLRTAFQYTNSNFSELYTAVGPSGNNIVVPGTATITGDLTVRTNKLAVNSSGVGIGTASPNYLFDVRGTDTTVGLIAGVTKGIRFVAGASTLKIEGVDNTGAVSYQPLSIGGSALDFSLSGTTALTLNSTANLVLKGGTTTANGVGVTFPATQVASSDANCLDDYEEGTWTATITGSTISGVGVYTDNTGKYTKVGNLVTVQVYINWTAHTGTGDMRISGLPFTSADLSGCAFGFVSNIELTAGYILTGFTNSSLISLQQTPSGGGGSLSVPVDSVGSLVVTVSYRV